MISTTSAFSNLIEACMVTMLLLLICATANAQYIPDVGVLVLYTDEANADSRTPIRTRMCNQINSVNTSYQNSDTHLRPRLLDPIRHNVHGDAHRI